MKFLGFQIGESYFGVPLEQVKEVIAFADFTPVPGVPDYCLGIMNLRDQIIPILDLRIKFKVEPTLTHDTSVIVCDLQGAVVGIVVDVIHNVTAPTESEVMTVPTGMPGTNPAMAGLVTQVVHKDGKLALTLDMLKVIGGNVVDLKMIQESHAAMKTAA